MQTWDILILGAGPAGLYAAIHLAPLKVLVLEKKPSPAKKLLISGGGKCNLTNIRPIQEFMGCYGRHGATQTGLNAFFHPRARPGRTGRPFF